MPSQIKSRGCRCFKQWRCQKLRNIGAEFPNKLEEKLLPGGYCVYKFSEKTPSSRIVSEQVRIYALQIKLLRAREEVLQGITILLLNQGGHVLEKECPVRTMPR